MRRLLFYCLIAISSTMRQGGERSNPHCPFVVGIQMPASGELELHFKPPYKKPLCFVDLGEAALDPKPAIMHIATKPSAYIEIRCREDAP